MQPSKNIFDQGFWFKYIFPIKFKIHILNLTLLPKNSVPFEGQYYSSCYDIKPVRKEEGKSYWKIPLCDDDATREK